MYRSILLAAFVYGLLLTGLIALRGEFIALAIPFMLYLLYGFWSAPEEMDLRIERSLSNDRTTPDSEVVVTITVINQGSDIEELFLEDNIPPNLTVRIGSPRHLLWLPKGSSHTFTYTVIGPRGSYPFETISVAAVDLFGVNRHEQFIRAKDRLFIFPEFRRLKHVSIRPRRTRVYAGSIPARVGGSGTEFFGVREYQFGDSPRTINWRVSARHDENLYSNEYQQERVADVGLVLDARTRANLLHHNQSIFESSVTAIAALSDAFLNQGNRVGLLVYGNYLGWTLPGYGKIQRERIMQALAHAEIGVSSVFAGLEHLSPRMFPPESQIVLVSSLVNDDLNVLVQLRGRGYQVLVISPDPVKFELGFLPPSSQVNLAARVIRMERDLLIHRLERAGIHVIEWDVSIPLDQAVGPVLMRQRRVL
ncbi:MAG: DUF58 domain-containing protein [Anaerolineales bacterium]|uniref:DUF58 domain-containing protein n=1 Tax=Candidatus Villigracilis proximus TaxID=3140683 RepID=UPI003136619C|nr:DUF58 domain-containing protein [Anaerolineales bacterium]